jgi:PmbA protein
MIERIIELVKSFPEISDWSISKSELRKNEIYLIQDKTESERIVSSDTYTVSLYVDKEIEGNKMRGMAYQIFSSDLPDEDVKKLISDAIFAASLGLNPHYNLDEKKENEEEHLACDCYLYENTADAVTEIKAQIFQSMAKEKDVKLASAEVFITCSGNRFVTSRGVDVTENKTRIMLEVVMLAGEGENEVESSVIRNERYLEVLDIPNLIKEYAAHARNSLVAALPDSGKFDVIFTGEALQNFFDYYVAQCSGSSAYYKTSRFELGKDVVSEAKGDTITLFSDPTLKGGLRTEKYDGYGTLLEKYAIIENGVFKTIAADARFGSYLNIPIKGNCTNVVVSGGEHSFDDLLTENTFVLSRFSTFSPNGTTGAFSGEIRSGFQLKNGEHLQVKGGSVTGLMDNAMKDVYFSKEMTQHGTYFGPKYIKVSMLDIAGK